MLPLLARHARGPALQALQLCRHSAAAVACRMLSQAVPAVDHQAQEASSSSAQPVPSWRSTHNAASTWFQRDPTGHIVPHGGSLVNLFAPKEQHAELIASATHRHECSERNACDVELLTIGGFSPLTGFMNKNVYEHVVEHMRLPGSNLLFGLPVVMDTREEGIKEGSRVLLTYKGQNLAVLDVESKWAPNKVKETLKCYKTSSLEHPGVKMVAWERGQYYIGGRVTGLALPQRVFPCRTPEQVRASLPADTDVVVFQCRNPVHRAHYELFTRALDASNVRPGSVCLVHPTCGPTQDDDIPGLVRYHTYEVLKAELNNPRIMWAYLPYSMHMAGPREAIQHMILRKNYGCTHFIVGRDMAGSKSCQSGDDFYGTYDAQETANQHAAELGMRTVPSLDVVYTEEHGYVTADKARDLKVRKLSGTKFRQMLRAGEDIPEWFAFKSVVQVLRQHAQSKA